MYKSKSAWQANQVTLSYGSLFMVVACLITAGIGWYCNDWKAAVSVGLAAICVLGFFLSGLVVENYALGMANLAGMILTLIWLICRLAILAVIFVKLSEKASTRAVILGNWFAIGALVAIISWVFGLVIGEKRARVPIYEPLEEKSEK